jgi:hypothetical protein
MNYLNHNKICETINKKNPEKIKEKEKYMQFLKLFLKLKFQKLPNSHLGQQIPARPVFDLAIEKNLLTKQWQDFILQEIEQPFKYAKYINLDKNKSFKNQNENIGLNNNYNDQGKNKNNLETIDEEGNNMFI